VSAIENIAPDDLPLLFGFLDLFFPRFGSGVPGLLDFLQNRCAGLEECKRASERVSRPQAQSVPADTALPFYFANVIVVRD
jgi:hypothetical protein